MGPGSSSVWAEYSQSGVTGKNQNLFNGLGNQWYGTWETWNLEQPSMKTSKGFIHVGYNFIIYMEVSEIDIAKLFGSCQHILKWSYVCGTFSSLIDIYINSKLYKTIQFSTNNSIIFSHELNGSCLSHTRRKYCW